MRVMPRVSEGPWFDSGMPRSQLKETSDAYNDSWVDFFYFSGRYSHRLCAHLSWHSACAWVVEALGQKTMNAIEWFALGYSGAGLFVLGWLFGAYRGIVAERRRQLCET